MKTASDSDFDHVIHADIRDFVREIRLPMLRTRLFCVVAFCKRTLFQRDGRKSTLFYYKYSKIQMGPLVKISHLFLCDHISDHDVVILVRLLLRYPSGMAYSDILNPCVWGSLFPT